MFLPVSITLAAPEHQIASNSSRLRAPYDQNPPVVNFGKKWDSAGNPQEDAGDSHKYVLAHERQSLLSALRISSSARCLKFDRARIFVPHPNFNVDTCGPKKFMSDLPHVPPTPPSQH